MSPWNVARQSPLSMWFPRQEYWSEFAFPCPGESSWPRDRTRVASQADSLPLSQWGPILSFYGQQNAPNWKVKWLFLRLNLASLKIYVFLENIYIVMEVNIFLVPTDVYSHVLAYCCNFYKCCSISFWFLVSDLIVSIAKIPCAASWCQFVLNWCCLLIPWI